MNEVIVISKFAQLTKRAEGATVQAGGKVVKEKFCPSLNQEAKTSGI